MNIKTASLGLDQFSDQMKRLDAAARKLEQSIREDTNKLIAQLKDRYPNSPLLTEGSLMAPLCIEGREVPLTRALSWIIGGRASADRSELSMALLQALLDLIIDHDTPIDHDLPTGWLIKPEAIVDGGRLDILLEGRYAGVDRCIVIEAKISATERDGQLKVYEQWLLKKGITSSHMVFLTTSGRSAVSGSNNGKIPEHAISYEQLLNRLLKAFRQYDNKSNYSGELEFTRLFLADLARLCGTHIASDTNIFGQLEVLMTSLQVEKA